MVVMGRIDRFPPLGRAMWALAEWAWCGRVHVLLPDMVAESGVGRGVVMRDRGSTLGRGVRGGLYVHSPYTGRVLDGGGYS